MIQVSKNLYVGNALDCETLEFDNNWSIIHACKTPCHQKVLNYSKSLPSHHPHYLIFPQERHLYLNLVDMEKILPKFADPIFEAAMEFLRQAKNQVLIHCNQGISRSPAIALVHLAKCGVIRHDSYALAHNDFCNLYSNYNPGSGIIRYLQERWGYLMDR